MEVMSIIGFVGGLIGSIMDFTMMVMYIIMVTKFFELLFDTDGKVRQNLKKYCVYYSIVPLAVIHIFSNLFSISFWISIVYSPQDKDSCIKNVNMFIKLLPYSDYINCFLPNLIAVIVLYVLNVFGSMPATCCELYSEDGTMGSRTVSVYESKITYNYKSTRNSGVGISDY